MYCNKSCDRVVMRPVLNCYPPPGPDRHNTHNVRIGKKNTNRGQCSPGYMYHCQRKNLRLHLVELMPMAARVLLLLLGAEGAYCWAPLGLRPTLDVPALHAPPPPLSLRPRSAAAAAVGVPRSAAIVLKVTADDVELAVEVAEKLWGEALEAREKAEKLSTEAEERSEQSETTTESAAKTADESAKFSLSMLGDAQQAMSAGECYEMPTRASCLDNWFISGLTSLTVHA